MIAQYGFKDGTGEWFVIIDTEKCTGCGNCVEACPAKIFEVGENEFEPLKEEAVASVRAEERKKIKYTCAPCQPRYGQNQLPCEASCAPGAISHSDGWKVVFGRKKET